MASSLAGFIDSIPRIRGLCRAAAGILGVQGASLEDRTDSLAEYDARASRRCGRPGRFVLQIRECSQTALMSGSAVGVAMRK